MKLKPPLTIDFYIGREITSKGLITGVWLLTVYLFVALLDLVEDVGVEGQFGFIIEILIFSIPRMVYELSPMILLIGTILAMSTLSRNHELIALLAGGVSKFRITVSVVGYAMIVALLVFFLGEFIVPASETKQDQVKHSHVNSQDMESISDGLWYRDHNQFIHVTFLPNESDLRDVDIYHFDSMGRLVKQTHAVGGIIDEEDNALKLYGVMESVLENRMIQRRSVESKDLPIEAELNVIGAHKRDPAQLTAYDLYRATRFLRDNGLKTEFLDLAFWNRFVMPLSMFVMALFAVLFTYRYRPRISTGQLVFIGLIFGLLYYAVQQSVGYVTMLYGFQPVFGTLAAFMLFSLGAIVALVRI